MLQAGGGGLAPERERRSRGDGVVWEMGGSVQPVMEESVVATHMALYTGR